MVWHLLERAKARESRGEMAGSREECVRFAHRLDARVVPAGGLDPVRGGPLQRLSDHLELEGGRVRVAAGGGVALGVPLGPHGEGCG
eukprot:scaffold205610_cov39-Tisochrysis_lutea.AAC.4